MQIPSNILQNPARSVQVGDNLSSSLIRLWRTQLRASQLRLLQEALDHVLELLLVVLLAPLGVRDVSQCWTALSGPLTCSGSGSGAHNGLLDYEVLVLDPVACNVLSGEQMLAGDLATHVVDTAA